MAAYPTTYISRTSSAVPDAGIRAEAADDGTIKFRKDRDVAAYGLQIVHEMLSQADYDALLAFIDANGFGPHTLTLHGVDYVITLINLPEQVDRKGSRYMVVAKAIGVLA